MTLITKTTTAADIKRFIDRTTYQNLTTSASTGGGAFERVNVELDDGRGATIYLGADSRGRAFAWGEAESSCHATFDRCVEFSGYTMETLYSRMVESLVTAGRAQS
jgi:hypothetical protein